MSNFKKALEVCGLSLQDAADFLETSKSNVDSIASGRRSASPDMWQRLARLWADISRSAEAAAEEMDMEGINSRAFNDLNVLQTRPSPNSAADVANAMAILQALAERRD